MKLVRVLARFAYIFGAIAILFSAFGLSKWGWIWGTLLVIFGSIYGWKN